MPSFCLRGSCVSTRWSPIIHLTFVLLVVVIEFGCISFVCLRFIHINSFILFPHSLGLVFFPLRGFPSGRHWNILISSPAGGCCLEHVTPAWCNWLIFPVSWSNPFLLCFAFGVHCGMEDCSTEQACLDPGSAASLTSILLTFGWQTTPDAVAQEGGPVRGVCFPPQYYQDIPSGFHVSWYDFRSIHVHTCRMLSLIRVRHTWNT